MANEELVESIGSPALKHAVAAGLPPLMSYTCSEAATFTGVTAPVLREEVRAGRLHGFIPNGNVRGIRISVADIDKWMSNWGRGE